MPSALPFFRRQVVFLTGSTGHLGACLLYKLVLTVQIAEIYVLIRGTPEQTIMAWKALMPIHAIKIIETRKVRFISGDMIQPNLGISEADIIDMTAVVTVVIHAAANISLKATLLDAVHNNCLPSLELARLASSFSKLISFVQVSSLYALSFLPDGPVQERLYMIDDPEQVLSNVMAGHDTSVQKYAWPYARSKHIMECLLTTRYPDLPMVILRPSSIGPAIFQPFELYGKPQSMPISSFCARLMYPSNKTNLFHAATGSGSGTNILDEIPVDLVASVLLQNIQMGTRGPVHASSRLYVSRTFDDFVEDVNKWVPTYWKTKLPAVKFTTDRLVQPCQIARFYKMSTRSWLFSVTSRGLDQYGPLGISLAGHNADEYARKRVQIVFKETQRILEQARHAKL